MARMIKFGKPTMKTKGAVGDIYIDKTTGKSYKCVLAYGVGDKREYTWREMDVPVEHDEEVPEVTPKAKPKAKKEPEAVQEPVVEATEVAEEPEAEPEVEKPKPKRNNYHKQYKNNTQ